VTALNLVTTPISVTKQPTDAATADQPAPVAS
jgi:hypothetical protein